MNHLVKTHVPCWCNLTHHAVQQYISRYEPTKSGEEAERELFNLLSSAKPSGKTTYGHSIFVSGERPDLRMVIKDRNVCVTVLPPLNCQTDDNLFLQEELEEASVRFSLERQTIEAEIATLEIERDAFDQQRKELGEKKGLVSRKIDMLRQRLKKIS